MRARISVRTSSLYSGGKMRARTLVWNNYFVYVGGNMGKRWYQAVTSSCGIDRVMRSRLDSCHGVMISRQSPWLML
jgi:hypothetical protein